jgi:LysR family glycine cleavage system transcriptional activator
VEDELARGTLVVACNRALQGERAYCLVQPERGEERAAVSSFKAWLLQAAQG